MVRGNIFSLKGKICLEFFNKNKQTNKQTNNQGMIVAVLVSPKWEAILLLGRKALTFLVGMCHMGFQK